MTVIPVAYIAAGSIDAVLTSEEGTLATYGFMLAYALVALAAPVYLRQDRRGQAARLGPRPARRGHDAVRLLRQLDTDGDTERHLPRPDRRVRRPAVRVHRLDRDRPGLVPRSSSSTRPEVVRAAGTWGDASDPNAAAEEAAGNRRPDPTWGRPACPPLCISRGTATRQLRVRSPAPRSAARSSAGRARTGRPAR